MTREEKAEITKEYLNNTFKQTEENQLAIMIGSKCFYEGLEKGLAEGKPKWHDLRKDPNDLPPKVKGCNFSTYVFSDNGNFVYYDYENKTFATNMITPIRIIAWCELPKFEEK